MFVCCECCVMTGGADHSFGEVLPTVVCRCVRSRNLVNEEALAHWGLSRHMQTNKTYRIKRRKYPYKAVTEKLESGTRRSLYHEKH